ncbi:hypothetical protein [Telluribacter sp.]|jgi:hypothetical protein|uniref:hypothetical protein n=1 Tax=Telluribacter sp. TaxID=1978767 RepID=UPI002E15515A|nr:hypothetical protein [Telluribacter sp.]
MRKRILLAAFLLTLISTAQQCGIGPDRLRDGCFAGSPLETIPWAKDQLAGFQQPKSGPLRVVVYSYRNEQFLAFVNPILSSPMSYIFDCSGTSIAQRNINYNNFYDEAKKLKVLLEGTY